MRTSIPFALNHVSAPSLDCKRFIDLAARLGCIGVELRNDLAEKKLNDRAFFDGEEPATVGAYAQKKGVRLLGLSEVYGFNNWSPAMAEKVRRLIAQAVSSGAESISLIPRNDAPAQTDTERASHLRTALSAILPMLAEAGLVGLIEPLGFATSSLRSKREAVEAIEAAGGETSFRLVHDTFHHHIAGETDYFPEYTGIVHISGVVNPDLAADRMRDEHRGLVDARDRLDNVAQIKSLLDAGYTGSFSVEAFSPVVHTLSDPEAEFGRSFDYLRSAIR